MGNINFPKGVQITFADVPLDAEELEKRLNGVLSIYDQVCKTVKNGLESDHPTFVEELVDYFPYIPYGKDANSTDIRAGSMEVDDNCVAVSYVIESLGCKVKFPVSVILDTIYGKDEWDIHKIVDGTILHKGFFSVFAKNNTYKEERVFSLSEAASILLKNSVDADMIGCFGVSKYTKAFPVESAQDLVNQGIGQMMLGSFDIIPKAFVMRKNVRVTSFMLLTAYNNAPTWIQFRRIKDSETNLFTQEKVFRVNVQELFASPESSHIRERFLVAKRNCINHIMNDQFIRMFFDETLAYGDSDVIDKISEIDGIYEGLHSLEVNGLLPPDDA